MMEDKQMQVNGVAGQVFVSCELLARIYAAIWVENNPSTTKTKLSTSHPARTEPNQDLLILAAKKYFRVEDFSDEDFQAAVEAIYVIGGEYRWLTLTELLPNNADRLWVEFYVKEYIVQFGKK